MIRRWGIIGILTLELACAPSSIGQHNALLPYHLESGSRLWINGTATVGSYRCGTVAVFGTGDLNPERYGPSKSDPGGNSLREDAHVEVLVTMLDCGNPAMNRDMYAALKANRDSTIQYFLTAAEVMFDSSLTKGPLRLRTIGDLSIAGVTRRDTIIADVRGLPNGRFEIQGQKDLSMLDYQIIPPSKFFGLIRAREQLVVSFDLIAAPDSERISGKTAHAMQ